MAELIVERGPRAGTHVPLSRELACTIGSDPSCSLALESPGIGQQHVIVKALKDAGFGLKAVTGTVTLNGQAVPAARLKDGDVVEFCGVRLRYAENGRALAPQTLGGFKLLQVLGRGGMGTVYEAEQVSLHRNVALKVMSKELTSDPVFVARFVAEARAAARLSHPNVVQVFDVGHDGDTYYFSMELMHAGSLEKRVKQGKLPVEEAANLVRDAARGLAFAESLRIVHRDIKPDNLMLDQHGHCKIADLGLAQTDEDDQSKVLGTPHFMSPEQVQKKPLDHRSDLYSLGCTFYRLVTGTTPFKGATAKEILKAQVTETAKPAHEVEPAVPLAIGQLIARLMAKDPADRPQSANELIAELDQVLAPRHRRGLMLAIAGCAVLLAGGALVYALTRPKGETVRIIEKDPDAARLAEEKRQADAEIARMRVRDQGLTGAALADAYEQVAREHPSTRAAETARAEAVRLREELTRAADARTQHDTAVREAIDRLAGEVRPPLGAGDFSKAAAALRAPWLAAELRADPKVQAAQQAHLAALQQAATERRAALETALGQAMTNRDAAAVRSAAAALEPLVAADGGWPAEALPERQPVQELIAAAGRLAGELDAEQKTRAETAAWQAFTKTYTQPDGVLAQVLAFDLTGAAQRAQQVANETERTQASARARELAAATQDAQRFFAAFGQAAAAGTLEVVVEDGGPPQPVAGFTATGADAGLTLKPPKTSPGAKPTLVRLAQLGGSALPRVFVLPAGAEGSTGRAAFLALHALADQLHAARHYLARIEPNEDDSGTGTSGYPQSRELLTAAQAALAGRNEPYVAALAEELTAAERLVLALRAFSERRNLSAAGHLERLLAEHANSLLVQALR